MWSLLSVMHFSEFELVNTPRSSEIHNSQQAFLYSWHMFFDSISVESYGLCHFRNQRVRPRVLSFWTYQNPRFSLITMWWSVVSSMPCPGSPKICRSCQDKLSDCFFLIIPKIMWKWNSPFPKEHSPDSRKTRWWFQRFLIFKPTWGNNPIWRAYFSNGWLNHQLEKHWGHVFVFLHVCCMDVGNLNHWVKILQLHSMGLFSSQALRKLEEIDWDMPQMSKGQQYLERH